MIVGHKKQWQYLLESVKQNKLAHAFLFSGQEKLGKKTLAIEFSRHFFKEDVIKRQHPDFILIEPEKKEIKITQIRECIWRLNLKPALAPFKIAIIDEAHCLNQEAQNSLLKTLEEPKGNSVIFLVSEHPERLFPTISSRCQTLKFYPVPKEEIEKYLRLQKVSENKIEEICNISGGRPGVAIDLITSSDKLKNRKALISNFIKVSNSDLAVRFQYADSLAKEPQNLKETLDILLRHFRNILISGIVNVSQQKYSFNKINKFDSAASAAKINKFDSAASAAKIKDIIKIIEETKFLISSTNVNPRLALEILMMEV